MRTIVDPRELLCDFDFKSRYRRERGPKLGPLWVTLRTCALRPRFVEYYRTRKGWHVTVRLIHAVEPAEQIALQAIMGSDRRREGLNIMRVICMRRAGASDFWQARWNILFRRKLS